MSTKFVDYIASTCLPCTCKGTSNVILCTKYNQTMPAQITDSGASCCSAGSWQYTIQYDSADLPVGVTALASDDITGVVCKGCLTTWIEEQFDTETINKHTFSVAWDISATAPGDLSFVTLSVTNPSSVKALKGVVGYNMQLSFVSNIDYATGVNGLLFADNVSLAETPRSLTQQDAVTGTSAGQSGVDAVQSFDVPPGATVEFKLQLTSANTIPPSGTDIVNSQIWFLGSVSA